MSEQDELVEALAEYAHNAWSGWMRYMFSKSNMNADGSVTIPVGYVANLRRLMHAAYDDMPKTSQESDRVEARKMLMIVGIELIQKAKTVL